MIILGFRFLGTIFLIISCATRVPQVSDNQKLQMKEFDERVKIEELDSISRSQNLDSQTGTSKKSDSPINILKSTKEREQRLEPFGYSNSFKDKDSRSKNSRTRNQVAVRLPLIEGQEGFIGRRPIVDPFKPGEKVVYNVTYLGLTAGQMSLEVLPMVQVNGRKHYHFKGRIWTTPMFSSVYTVDDSISSMLDFESLTPTVYKLHVSESDMVKESRFYIDWKTLEAFFWEKKITKRDGERETKYSWKVEPFSQDVFSSLFYLRVFPWDIGMERAFPVADNQQNLIYKGKALRKEKIKILAGEFNSIVIEPKIELQGKFKPSGEIYIWLSDDEFRQILKIEARVALGSLRAEAIKVVR